MKPNETLTNHSGTQYSTHNGNRSRHNGTQRQSAVSTPCCKIGATGFRIFKDMLNRTFYKRISKFATTEIANDVVEGSLTIQVRDGTVLPEPNAAKNIPGVIFVDKERIEYFY